MPINKSQNCTRIGRSCATVKVTNYSVGVGMFGPTFFHPCDTSLIRSLFVNPDRGINLTCWHGSTRKSGHQIRLPVGVLCIRSVNVWLFAWAARVRRPACHDTNPDEDETYDQRGLRLRLSYSAFKILRKNNLSKNRKCVYFAPAARIQQKQEQPIKGATLSSIRRPAPATASPCSRPSPVGWGGGVFNLTKEV